MKHIQTGKMGERLAAQWLIQNGYEILHKTGDVADMKLISSLCKTIFAIAWKSRRGEEQIMVTRSKV